MMIRLERQGHQMTVHVERAVTDDGAIKDCKTHEVRTVDLTPDLASILKKHLTWLRAEALRTGSGEPQWMFQREDGSRMNKDYLGNVFRRTLKQAGLSHHRVYDCRHTYSCLLLGDGAPITYVAAQLGHSSPATTMRYYARWMPTKGKRWVNTLDRKMNDSPSADTISGFLEPKSGTTADHA